LVWGVSLYCYGVSPDIKTNSQIRDKFKPKLDIIFVIDNSGSMKKNDPNFITREVVTSFSNALGNKSRLGMVIFDQTARLVEPLTEKRGDELDSKFVKSLEKVNYKGQFTNSPAGIERAIYELKTNGRDDAERAIIFLTDGIVDTGDKLKDVISERWLKEDLAEESQKAGIRIFGIAFTKMADVNLIQTLALKTNGEYFRAVRAADIPDVFIKIIEHIIKTPVEPPVEPPVETKAPTQIKTTQKTLPLKGYQSPSSASSRKGFLLPLILIVSLILLGVIVSFKLFNRKTKAPVKSVADNQVSGLPLTSDQTIPEATLIDIEKVSLNGVLPLVLNKSKITIGRNSSNDIVIPHDAISSFHATIEFKNGFFCLEDYRSTNGTSLNNEKISPHQSIKLKSGDIINFSIFEFRFMMSGHDLMGETVMLGSSSLQLDEEHTLIIHSKKEGVELKPSDRGKKTSEKDETFDEKDKTIIINDYKAFKDCLNKHLQRISNLGSSHKTFVDEYFTINIIDILASNAKELMHHSQTDLDGHSLPYAKPPVLYQLCTSPLEMAQAGTWFRQKYGGYTKFLTQSLGSDHFTANECTTLCVITYGRTNDAWVSITIVPTDSNSESVNIMSVEFLTKEEKRALWLDHWDFDQVS
jgi:pSer/pThr/pTyr-binding forkhead associated (FHA) protein/Mg-chelatase subunit ChlD